ncbi:hypothetical protein [Nonomuraea sp. NPDC049504]|uniref:hypothetical protein n=1 Tax=Nonomuraea sp. NPDC049504 TaxID=3154729 RepID=UPI00342B67F6
MRLYVETLISADIDRIWQATQNLDQHQRWDLRFGRITALGSGRLRYSTLGISGTAIASGDRHAADGTRTSALRFGSTHPLSPIRSGAGYWRYLPTPAGTRFLTSYDYRPRLLPRRLMWWATAWSFDRLRLSLETGVTPERLLRRALGEVAVRASAVIAAGCALPLWATLTVLIAALLWPPLPGTPAARRCLRHHHRHHRHRPERQEPPCHRSSSARSAPASTASTPSSSAASASGSTQERPASAPA